MRPISFGKLTVAASGTPVNLGQTTLSSNISAADETLVVVSASPFCQDMVPFKMDIDPTGTVETVIVKGISGTTFTIQRGMEGSVAAAHVGGVALVARFPFTGWDLESVSGGSGKVYWGKAGLNISSGAGVIHEFVPQSTAVNDRRHFMAVSQVGNPLKLEDYGLDVATSAQGLWVTLWER